VGINDPKTGVAIMEYVKPNHLYFLWDAVQKPSISAITIFRKSLELFKEQLGTEQLKSEVADIAKTREKKDRERLIKFVEDVLSVEYKGLQDTIDKLSKEIEKHQGHLTLKLRDRTAKMQMVEAGTSNNFDERANKMIRDLYSQKHVRGVRIVKDGVHIITDTVYVIDPRTKLNHEVGAFRIEVPTDVNKEILMLNTTQQITGYNSRGMHAPHVFPDGKPCLGDLVESLPQIRAAHNYSAIAALCILYLENVNVDDAAGKYVNRWPLVKEDGTVVAWKDRDDKDKDIM